MSNVGRELTLRVTISDDYKSGWIWKSMAEKDPVHGVNISAISDGDLLQERDFYREVVEKALESCQFKTDYDFPNKVETECGKTFYQYPFGMYATTQDGDPLGTEWYPSLEYVENKYEVKPYEEGEVGESN